MTGWFLVIAILWSIAILYKVVTVRRRGEPYKFTMWDGGMMLSGVEMGPAATWVFGAFVVALGAVSIYVLNMWSHL